MLIAVDFDGTCVEHDYPRIGKEMPYATEILKGLVGVGHKLVLWTCRENHPTDINRQQLQEAVDWFKERGIPLYGANVTPVEYEFREFADERRKVHCDLYIDDRNLGGFPGWLETYRIITGDTFDPDKRTYQEAEGPRVQSGR